MAFQTDRLYRNEIVNIHRNSHIHINTIANNYTLSHLKWREKQDRGCDRRCHIKYSHTLRMIYEGIIDNATEI